jgi:hypothetical protein
MLRGAFTLVCWTAASSAACAQPPDAPSEGGGMMDYTAGYALVLLGVGLGLLVVLHGSSRRERERPEGYVAKDILKEE